MVKKGIFPYTEPMPEEIQYKLIDTDKKLSAFRNYLHTNKITELAMDIEGEFNLHCYGEQLCLIQIFDGTEFTIIDPFKISTGELKKLLESKIVKIFFDASSDRMLIYRQYKIQLKSVLDLKYHVEVLNLEKRGLNSLLDAMLGIQVSKKFQMYNWTKRPINSAAMQYALEDVKYLFHLRDLLHKRIEEQGKIHDLISTIVQQDVDYDKKSIPAYRKRNSFKTLSAEKKALADQIYELREETAKKLNWPPANVLSNDNIIRLAKGSFGNVDIPINPRVRESDRQKLIQEIRKIL